MIVFNHSQKLSSQKSFFQSFILIIIAISLGVNDIVTGFKIAGVSIDRIIQIFIFVFLIPSFKKELGDVKIKFIFYIICCFFFLINLKYFVLASSEDVEFMFIVREGVRVIMMGIYFYLAYYLIKKDINKLNIILFIHFLAFALAFFQNPITPLTEFAQNIRMGVFSANMKAHDLAIYSGFLSDTSRDFFRVTGPYGQTITMSYAIVSSVLIASYLYFIKKNNIYLVYILFCFLIITMSLTRSGIIAVLVMLIFSLRNHKKYIALFTFLSVLLLFEMILKSNIDWSNYSRIIENDSSSSGKVWLIITGFVAVILNPLGVTTQAYQEVKEWGFSLSLNPHVLHFPSHNGLINLGFEYTIFGYFVISAFLFYLVRFARILNFRDKVFFFSAMAAYFLQQSFHNNGIFVRDFQILLFLAVYINHVNLSKYKRRSMYVVINSR